MDLLYVSYRACEVYYNWAAMQYKSTVKYGLYALQLVLGTVHSVLAIGNTLQPLM